MSTTKPNIRVLLVDDHAVVRVGYTLLLQSAPGIVVIAEAQDGEEACRKCQELKPEVVVMDLSLPGMGGLEAIRRISVQSPEVRILVFSMHEDTVFVEHALTAGASGYLTKNSAPEAMVSAVKRIAEGGIYLEPEIAQRLAYQKVRGNTTSFQKLSAREFEIFCLLAEGLNINVIAQRLSLSYKTVANYGTQIKDKLGVETSAELARMAIRHGLLKA